MTELLNSPIIRLFFDISVNDGWNLTAIMTYAIILGFIVLSIIENRKGK